jgi:hypothetical protein
MEEEEKGSIDSKEEIGYSYALLEVLKFLNYKDQSRFQQVSTFMRDLVVLKFDKAFAKLQ